MRDRRCPACPCCRVCCNVECTRDASTPSRIHIHRPRRALARRHVRHVALVELTSQHPARVSSFVRRASTHRISSTVLADSIARRTRARSSSVSLRPLPLAPFASPGVNVFATGTAGGAAGSTLEMDAASGVGSLAVPATTKSSAARFRSFSVTCSKSSTRTFRHRWMTQCR